VQPVRRTPMNEIDLLNARNNRIFAQLQSQINTDKDMFQNKLQTLDYGNQYGNIGNV